jgi:lysosomal acid lipase/cholesteryl ester hydrolase
MVPSAVFWSNILPRPWFIGALDASMRALFGWTMSQIPMKDKLELYPHLYSFTSVKSNVHWLQIIQRHRLQMYEEQGGIGALSQASSPDTVAAVRGVCIPDYPTRQIRTPMAIFSGGKVTIKEQSRAVEGIPVEVLTS